MAQKKHKKKTTKAKQQKVQKPLTRLEILRSRVRKIVEARSFKKVYVGFSLLVLAVSCSLWTVLGARVQQANADQLINALLFQNSQILHGAQFPNAHSFLLKWPLFVLVKLGGFSLVSYVAVTLATTLATVFGFAYVLYRIDRRPLVFGTICLMLASVLLLVPAQPYPGALLPVNMAMLTTRNLEYLIYIAALILCVRTPRYRSRQAVLVVGLFGLLFASDKLFLAMSLGGALAATIGYSVFKQWKLVTVSVTWLVLGGAGALASQIILGLINVSKITSISSQGAVPYHLIEGWHDGVLGMFYAVAGLMTNLGANPAWSATTVRGIPGAILQTTNGFALLGYVLHVAVFLGVTYLAGSLVVASVKEAPVHFSKPTTSVLLSVTLLWTAAIAVIQFVVTKHDYVVDARYLTICLFTLFVTAVTMLRKKKYSSELIVALGIVLFVAILGSSWAAIRTSRAQSLALQSISDRNHKVTGLLASHHVDALVGDYWRVVPAKLASRQQDLALISLGDCTNPRQTLTSTAWDLDLTKHSFAYLLSFDKGLTDFPKCNLEDVTARYGLPNSTELVAGSLNNPQEIVLFYDTGAHAYKHVRPKPHDTPVHALPTPLDDLTHTSCKVPTVMDIVAHQDDDLLFMSPDLIDSLQRHDCVRTVYLTAGDAGARDGYWLSREQGSQAAYAKMLGIPNVWTNQNVSLPGGQFIRIATLRDNTQVSLIYLHLPDGNLEGQGFQATKYESLAKLYTGQLDTLRSVDQQSRYTKAQLVSALTALLHAYKPSQVRAQSDYAGQEFRDHSDHRASGEFADLAYRRYESEEFDNAVTVPLSHYMGYPIRTNDVNVAGDQLDLKTAAFLEYAKHDGNVCQSLSDCDSTPTYGAYLRRQYSNDY